MLWRIFKAAAIVALVAVAALLGLARWKLDRVARDVARGATAGARSLKSATVHAQVWPPAAVMQDVEIRGDGGEIILRARSLLLPFAPGSIIGRGRTVGTPRLEGFSMTLRVPRTAGAAWPGALASAALPDWSNWVAEDGRIEVRFGDAPAAVAFVIESARLERHGAAMSLSGGVAGVRMQGDGEWRGRTLSLHLATGSLDAVSAASMLIESPAVVRGGVVSLEGVLTLDAKHASFRGDLETGDLVIEGASATPGPLERRLRSRRGRARVPIRVELDLTRGSDPARAFREAIAAASR